MNSEEIKNSLSSLITGDILIDEKTLETFSRDSSLFEIKPKVVIFPKNTDDVQAIVKWVAENKAKEPSLSITARSAGTDMSGGAINDSIILDFTKYMNAIIEVKDAVGVVQPGCFYRDFEKATLQQGLFMPAYTASREICAVGGMVANNSGGENTVKYGKVENFLEHCSSLTHIRLRGLMSISPFFEDVENSRPYFKKSRDLFEKFFVPYSKSTGIDPPILSMGMSHDFEIAVEEGSSMVRIGRAIFGERAKP